MKHVMLVSNHSFHEERNCNPLQKCCGSIISSFLICTCVIVIYRQYCLSTDSLIIVGTELCTVLVSVLKDKNEFTTVRAANVVYIRLTLVPPRFRRN